jgi:hypothetical protein
MSIEVETSLEIGRWRIVKSWQRARADYHELYEYRIEHRCGRLDLAADGWWPYTYAIHNRGYPCAQCKEAASEPIQAVFWFLKESEEW